MHDSWAYKSPNGRLFTKKVEIFDILGAAFPPPAPIEVKFWTAKRTRVPVGLAKFDLNRCNESPLWGEKPDFWPASKFNTGSLPLRGILPVKITSQGHTARKRLNARLFLYHRTLLTFTRWRDRMILTTRIDSH